MVNPRDQKIAIKEGILKVLKRDLICELDPLISSFKLETGFGDKVIREILTDLSNCDFLTMEGTEVKITDKGKSYGNTS